MNLRYLAVLATVILVWGTGLAQQNDFPQGFVGSVAAEPTRAPVGAAVVLAGSGFAANTLLELVWSSYDLTWDLGEVDGVYDGNFRGLTRTDTQAPLATVATDASGAFRHAFALPEDFGGTHNVLVRQAGVNLNRVGVEITPTLSIEPLEGPPGTDIHVTLTGLHSGQPMVWYQLTYDHAITGFLSAVGSRGTARATLPAAGRPGPHLIRLEDSPFGQPYLALDTSPWAFLEVPSQTFVVTDDAPVWPADLDTQALPAVAGHEPASEGPAMWSELEAAIVGTPTVLHGKGFDPGSELELSMTSMVGSRVTDSGFMAVLMPMGTVTVDADGRFAWPYDMPDILGGLHTVRASAVGADAPLAETSIKILPKAFPLNGQRFTYGEEIRFHVKGIGWTQTENIFGVVVDNVYIGYACGFSTNGDVTFALEAAFEPGWHVVDFYPSFYRNNSYSEVDETPFLFRHALLSWEDHPSGFHFRFAFEVVEDAVAATGN